MSEPRIGPSAEAMEFERMLGRCTCEPQWPDGDRKCDCPGCVYLQYQSSPELSKAIYSAIDTLIAKARREALEEAAKIVEKGLPPQMLSCVRRRDSAAIRALAAKEQT